MSRRKAPLAVLMSSPDEIETAFYESLQSADLDRMVSLWVQDELVRCIHPGGPLLVGITAIKAGFEALFARGPVAVHPADVKKLVTDQLVIHQVHERVLVPVREGEGSGEQVAWVLATNAYLKTPEGWRMVLHHASPGQPLDMPELHSGNASVLH